ncbi:MAG: YbjQ family protein [Thermoprotei archaeon]|jgi:uncharacterized protein YbjQ (UPF0145 family)
MDQFIVTTTPNVPGHRITKVLGIVCGITARTRGIGGKIISGIQSMLGGEVSAFTEEMIKARDEALKRAIDQAKSLGANAIIGLDFETSEVFESVVMVSVTGTAVIVTPET